MQLKKLTYKLLIGLVLIIAGAWIVKLVFGPSYYYGNDILEGKMKVYSPDSGRYNAVFIGSSVVLRNIDPKVFDSSLPDSLGITSFNLGSGGTLPPETYIFYENLLKQHGAGLKYAFIELRDIGIFDPFHLHTLRKRYWITPGEYLFILRSDLPSPKTRDIKLSNARYYGISMLERLFIVDYFNDIYGKSTEGREVQEFRLKMVRDEENRGFLGLEGRSVRQQQFLMDTTSLVRIAEAYRRVSSEREKYAHSTAHADRIKSLIELSEKHGVKCYFILHPKHRPDQITSTLLTAMQIPEKNLINLADPDITPELYLARYSFSESHFNMRGAQVLSKMIAEKFNSQLSTLN